MVTEYEQGSSFPGVIGRTVDESTPAWPAPARAKKGAPNVVFFVLDDVGYGQLSTGEALTALLDAEHLAPEQVRSHPLARTTIADLLDQFGRRPPDQLLALARRCGSTR